MVCPLTRLWWSVVCVFFWTLPVWAQESPKWPLTTRGRYIVDQAGVRVHWRAVNWYGSHLVGEVPEGLEHQPLAKVIGLIKEWGFNMVRLPFSDQMLHNKAPATPERLAANPNLWGKTPLEVMDAVIAALAQAEIMVVLNNHTTTSVWCCGFDTNSMWFTAGGTYPLREEDWQDDWMMLARRYGHNPWVVAADLRNEVRTGPYGDSVIPLTPAWGGGGPRDWHRAAQSLGRRLIGTGVPWLIVVEGINWQGLIPLVGSGGRPHLQPVPEDPIHLIEAGRLVYGVHTYGYTGPEHTGNEQTSPRRRRYHDMSRKELFKTFDQEFGFVLEPGFYYTAPVWLSEFGVGLGAPKNHPPHHPADFPDQTWFANLAEYVQSRDLDFAYWPLNPDDFGLVQKDWSNIRDNDWRTPYLKRILTPVPVQVVPQPEVWTLMDLRKGDFWGDHDLQSAEEPKDWLPGATKAACPRHQRVLGLSENMRALCGNPRASPFRAYPPEPSVVESVHETPVGQHTNYDWASGMTKYECPRGYLVTGLTKHWWGLSGIRCHKPESLSPQSCETLWMDQRDQRNSLSGGDFAVKSLKGQCRDGEYVAGLAQKDGTPKALLCCQARGEGEI